MEGKFDCSFDTGPNSRECGTLQSAVFEMSRNPAPDSAPIVPSNNGGLLVGMTLPVDETLLKEFSSGH